MPPSPLSLPTDIAALQALVLAQQAQLANRDTEIERLTLLIAKLRRMQFGRRSEQREQMLGQLELSLEELESVRAERSAAASAPERPAEPPHRPSRKPLPACHRPAHWSQLMIGTMEPPCDRHIGATP
jgi:hypothetical protein